VIEIRLSDLASVVFLTISAIIGPYGGIGELAKMPILFQKSGPRKQNEQANKDGNYANAN
jgi:hypothetical protein